MSVVIPDKIANMAASLGPKIPVISKLSSNVIRILGCNPGPMTLQGTNTYLLGTGNKRILVDTGDAGIPEYIKNLKMVLQDEKATIGTIILTHWHHDHVGGVNDVLKLLNHNDCRIWKFTRTDAQDICPEISKDIDISKLQNGQIFSVDDITVKVIHTPGHTTDHVILTMNDGVLFSGDCILGEGTAVFEDLYDYMKSLEQILCLKPKVIYPGHGNIINDPIPKIRFYIDHRNKRESEILDMLKTNVGKKFKVMDIVKVIYKEISENLWPAAAINVDHHLQKLAKEGIIVKNQLNGEDLWSYKNINSSL